MKKRFVVVPFNSSEFGDLFLEEIIPYQGNPTPAQTILTHLRSTALNCQSAVFEYDYVDEDYQDEFACFYSKAFKNYPHRCTRVHFFSCAIPKRTRMGFSRYRKSYLGFTILRPTDLQRVGRTILKPPLNDPDRQFINCATFYDTHILGDAFRVQAMPFIQQDTQVGACAQASLWMLARYMSRRFGHRRFLPAEINSLAKAHTAMGRQLPAESGLTAIQMLDALQGMGFAAVMYSRDTVDSCSQHIDAAFPVTGNTPQERELSQSLQRTAKLADIAYRYIESGLPVILGTDDHALVAVGHTYDPTIANAAAAIQRIPSFYTNNDNLGPYLESPLFRNGVTPLELSFLDVRMVISVTPSEATLRGEEAERMAMESVYGLLEERPAPGKNDKFRDILPRVRPEFSAWFGSLEYRTYLIESVRLQHDLRVEINEGNVMRLVGEKLLVLDYPKYVWVTEISSSTLLNRPNKRQRSCLGRVFVDSTAPSRTAGVMAIHFADLLLTQSRDHPEIAERFVFINSTPFKHRLCGL